MGAGFALGVDRVFVCPAWRAGGGGFAGARACGASGTGGWLEGWLEGDAEDVAEGAQGACGGGPGGEGFGNTGGLEEVVELAGEAGGVVAEFADQPEAGARHDGRGKGRFEAGARGFGGLRRFARAGGSAGGDMGEEARKTLARTGDAVPERGGDGAEEAEIGPDEGEDGRKDGVKARCGLLGGWGVHDLFVTWERKEGKEKYMSWGIFLGW